MNAHQKLLMSYPPAGAPSDSISFVAATGASYTTGTLINSPTSPAGVQSGDGLFAIIMARSTITPPAGWTLVKSQSNTGSLTQTIAIYKKDATSPSDSSTAFNWSQSSSARLALAYVLVRSSTGSLTVLGSDSATNTGASSSTQSVTVPVLTATSAGEIFIIAGSSELGGASNADVWAASSGATMRSTASVIGNRIGVETQSRNSGQSNATPMTLTYGDGAATGTFASVGCRVGVV